MGCCLNKMFLPSLMKLENVDAPRSLNIGGQQLNIQRTIGEGGYSYVFLCESAGRQVAVKKTIVDADDTERLRRTIAEAEFLRNLRHKNIVGYLGHDIRSRTGGQRRKEVWIALECCPTTLLDEMKSHVARGTHFPIQTVFKIFSDVVGGVAYLHGQNPPVTHRDLKVENVLKGTDGTYKLCDFGSATTLSYECGTRGHIAMLEDEIERNTTLVYRAPEQCDLWSKQRVDEKVDIWALGVMLYYISFFELPFQEQSLQIINCNYTIPEYKPDQCTEEIVNLIRTLLTADCTERPTIWGVSTMLSELYPKHLQIEEPADRQPQPNKFTPPPKV